MIDPNSPTYKQNTSILTPQEIKKSKLGDLKDRIFKIEQHVDAFYGRRNSDSCLIVASARQIPPLFSNRRTSEDAATRLQELRESKNRIGQLVEAMPRLSLEAVEKKVKHTGIMLTVEPPTPVLPARMLRERSWSSPAVLEYEPAEDDPF